MEVGYYIDDENALFEHEYGREKRLARYPVCSCCGEPIQDEYCYEIGKKLMCRECLDDEYRRDVDDLMEESA